MYGNQYTAILLLLVAGRRADALSDASPNPDGPAEAEVLTVVPTRRIRR